MDSYVRDNLSFYWVVEKRTRTSWTKLILENSSLNQFCTSFRLCTTYAGMTHVSNVYKSSACKWISAQSNHSAATRPRQHPCHSEPDSDALQHTNTACAISNSAILFQFSPSRNWWCTIHMWKEAACEMRKHWLLFVEQQKQVVALLVQPCDVYPSRSSAWTLASTVVIALVQRRCNVRLGRTRGGDMTPAVVCHTRSRQSCVEGHPLERPRWVGGERLCSTCRSNLIHRKHSTLNNCWQDLTHLFA